MYTFTALCNWMCTFIQFVMVQSDGFCCCNPVDLSNRCSHTKQHLVVPEAAVPLTLLLNTFVVVVPVYTQAVGLKKNSRWQSKSFLRMSVSHLI